jgi:hypothetical protein
MLDAGDCVRVRSGIEKGKNQVLRGLVYALGREHIEDGLGGQAAHLDAPWPYAPKSGDLHGAGIKRSLSRKL